MRKEVVVLQDRLEDKDRELAQQCKELKAYEKDVVAFRDICLHPLPSSMFAGF